MLKYHFSKSIYNCSIKLLIADILCSTVCCDSYRSDTSERFKLSFSGVRLATTSLRHVFTNFFSLYGNVPCYLICCQCDRVHCKFFEKTESASLTDISTLCLQSSVPLGNSWAILARSEVKLFRFETLKCNSEVWHKVSHFIPQKKNNSSHSG